MAATSSNDKLFRVKPRWTTTIGSGGVADDSTTTIPLSSVSGLNNGEAYVITMNRVNSSGEKQDTWETAIGTVSGTNLINCSRGVEGTASAWNRMVGWAETEHNQDGTHNNSKVAMLAGAQSFTGAKTFSEGLVVSDAKDIKFASGAKIERDGGHIVLTPESNKFVKVAVLRQNKTTNVYRNEAVILAGWHSVATDTQVYTQPWSITFGVTFAQVPIFVAMALAQEYSAEGSGYDYSANGVNNLNELVNAGVHSVSTTQAAGRCTKASSWTGSRYARFTWIAIGVLA